jgi:hypothetical protein
MPNKKQILAVALLAEAENSNGAGENPPKRRRRVWMKEWLLKFQMKSMYETLFYEWRITDPDRYRRVLR